MLITRAAILTKLLRIASIDAAIPEIQAAVDRHLAEAKQLEAEMRKHLDYERLRDESYNPAKDTDYQRMAAAYKDKPRAAAEGMLAVARSHGLSISDPAIREDLKDIYDAEYSRATAAGDNPAIKVLYYLVSYLGG